MGSWRNLKEMEDDLTLDELYLLVNSMHNREHREHKFMAALKGIDLDEEQGKSKFEDIERRAKEKLTGKTEEQQVFDLVGIEYDEDDD